MAQLAAARGLSVAAPIPSLTAGPMSGSSADVVDTVEISGRSTMQNRLFSRTPASVTYTPRNHPDSGSVYNYLTTQDRTTIASLYDYASQHDIDPERIDALAFDLAGYRSMEPQTAQPGNFLVGYDPQGLPHYGVTYSDTEEATAQRILTSKAIKDSALPAGFLRWTLAGAGHAGDLGLLEKFVYATSPTGSDGATDPNAVLAPRPRERFAAMQAAGLILTPEQGRALMASTTGRTTASERSFDNYANRIRNVAPFLTDDDKKSLGALYAMTADKYGPDSRKMKDIDRLARTLAVLRASGFTDGTSKMADLLVVVPADRTRATMQNDHDDLPRGLLDINA